jgi:hypothetical protein
MPNDLLRMSNRLGTVLAAVVGTLVERKLKLRNAPPLFRPDDMVKCRVVSDAKRQLLANVRGQGRECLDRSH